MEKSSKREKIPQSDCPLIMARYEAGETLSSIARTYDCSPPAISYVISRSRARQPGGEAARPPTHRPAGDRKSTRLNSSHRCISYAVFCLKKKTNHTSRTATSPGRAG